jgi:hypothetical protein
MAYFCVDGPASVKKTLKIGVGWHELNGLTDAVTNSSR